jgi:hypothetical protein
MRRADGRHDDAEAVEAGFRERRASILAELQCQDPEQAPDAAAFDPWGAPIGAPMMQRREACDRFLAQPAALRLLPLVPVMKGCVTAGRVARARAGPAGSAANVVQPVVGLDAAIPDGYAVEDRRRPAATVVEEHNRLSAPLALQGAPVRRALQRPARHPRAPAALAVGGAEGSVVLRPVSRAATSANARAPSPVGWP